jgi:hypothetical protein
MVAANSQWLVPTICCTCNGNNPTITPFAIHVGQLSSCFFSTGLHSAALPSLPFRERLWPSFQVLAKPFNHQSHPSTPLLTPKDHFNQMVCHISSEECLTLVSGTTSPFKHINHAWPGMIYQALHQGLQHPLKRIFPSATVIEYFNVITSSPLFQESTHPGVASALCSSLGTTPYFSVSLPLLVSRVQVALPFNHGDSPLKVDPSLSSYSEYYNVITELTTLTRVNLFLEPAHALCSFIAVAT